MRLRKVLHLVVLLIATFVASRSAFGAAGMTFHGRIILPSGHPLEASSVNFDLQVRSPGPENCLLYEETQNLNMTGSSGIFVLTIGSGIRVAPAVDGGNSLNKVFENRGTLTLPTCNLGNTYAPNSADGRNLVVQFNDNSGSGWQALPVQNMNFVPLAIEAMQVSGYTKDQLLRVADGVTATEFAASDWNALWALIQGTSTVYSKANGSNFSPTSNVNFNGQQITNLGTPTTASMAATKGYVDTNFLGLGGGTLAGSVNLGANSLTNVGHVVIANQGTLYLGKFTNPQEASFIAGPPALGGADTGRTWYNTTTGRMRYWDGLAAQNVASESYVGAQISVATASMVTAVNGTAGEINSTGGNTPTLSLLATGVAAASYGSSITVPQITVDSKGRITVASNVPISVTGALGYRPVNRAGDTMTGLLVLSADPSAASGAATKQYVDAVSTAASGAYLRKDGTTPLTADWNLGGYHISGLLDPTSASYAATKNYVDTKFAGSVTSVSGIAGQTVITGSSAAPTVGLATTGVSGATYGSSTQIPVLTIDSYGRVTAATYTAASGAVASVAGTAGQIQNNGTATNPVMGLVSTGVGAGSYGSLTQIPVITVDSYGRLTAAGSVSMATAVNAVETDPTVATFAKSATGIASRFTINGSNQLDLTNFGVAGTFGSTSQVPILTLDNYGRVTTASYLTVNDTSKLPLAGGTMAGNINMASYKLTNLGTPSASYDAATKAYVDAQVGAAGTVTSVNAISGDTVIGGTSAAPTVGLATTSVVAGTYGATDKTLILSVDSKGRLTSASQASIAILPSQLLQGGAQSGSYLSWNGSAWSPASFGASVNTAETDPTVPSYFKTLPQPRIVNNAGKIDLASSGVSAATYGSGTQVPVLTVDSYGRITSATFATASVTETDPTVSSWAKTVNPPSASFFSTTGNTLALTTTGVASGSYGSSTQIPVLTIDAYGRVTAATYTSASGAVASVGGTTGQIQNNGTAVNPVLGLVSTGVAAATYGSVSQIPIITVDSYGRVTTASYLSAAIAPSQLTQGGASNTNFLQWNGSNWAAASFSSSVNASETDPTVSSWAKTVNPPSATYFSTTGNILSLASSGVTAATYGSSTQVPVLTVDSKGRITSATFATASVTETDPTVATFAKTATGISARFITNGSNQLDLANSGVTAATYGSLSAIPVITVDSYGRLTAASSVSLASAETDPTVSSWAKTANPPSASFFSTTGNILSLSTTGVSANTYGSSSQIPILTVDNYGRVTSATYANIAAGGVTSVSASAGQTVVSGAASAPVVGLATTGVSSGTYGSSSQIPIFTVDSFGRITTASFLSAAIAPSQITQAGAQSGSYLSWNGSQWAPASFGASVASAETDPTVSAWAKTANPPSSTYFTTSGSTLSLANSGVTSATYGSSTQIPVLTVDAKGRITSATYASVPTTISLSSITAATAINTIDSANFAQTWNWSTATTQNPMWLTANSLTTGSLLNVTSSSGSLNSTNGLLYVANTTAATFGTVARLQANSTAGSGVTVLANGNVGVGTSSPTSAFQVTPAPVATGFGLNVNINGGATSDPGTGYGGGVNITGGTGNTGTSWGGNVIVAGGDGVNKGGYTKLVGGNAASGGDVVLQSGSGTSNSGGNVNITAGNSSGWFGGNVTIDAGTGITNGGVNIGTSNAATVTIGGTSANVAVGKNASSTAKFDVKGTIGLSGATSGTLTFAAPATVTSGNYTWPAATPSSNMVLQSDNTGQLSWVAGGNYSSGSIIAASFGTAAAPGLTFTGNTNTGFFDNGGNTIGITVGGSNLWNITSSSFGSTTTGGALISNSNVGTASFPTYSFAGDTGTGWFRAAASTLAAATGGVERVRIDSSGNVGIGVASPGNALDISSGNPYSGIKIRNSSSTNKYPFEMVTGSPGNYDDEVLFKTNGQKFLEVAGAGNSTVSLWGSTVNVGSGQTGAGFLQMNSGNSTAAPTLAIQRATGSAGQSLFFTDSSGASEFGLTQSFSYSPTLFAKGDFQIEIDRNSSGTGAFEIAKGGGGFGRIGTDGTSLFKITNSGNVGIGATNPVAPLDVNGLVAVSETGGLAFNTYYSSGWKYRANGYGNAFYQSSTGDLFLSTFGSNASGTGAAATENKRMAFLNNGNVGIGTTSPSARLQLPAGASTASSAPLKFTSGTNLSTPEAGAMEYDGTNLYITDNTNIRRTIATSGSGGSAYGAGSIVAASFGTAASPGLTFNGDTSTGFFRNGASTIGITAGGTNLWNISSSGIASPTTGGALIANSIGTASYPTYSFVGDPGTGWFRPAASTLAAATGGSERIRIDSSGNVGIGTTNPLVTLDVLKSSAGSYEPTSGTATSALFRIENSNNNVLDFGNGPTASYGSWIQSTDKTSLAVSYPLLLNPNGGNVGIGTTNPSLARLQVAGGGIAHVGGGTGGIKAQYGPSYTNIFLRLDHQGDAGGAQIDWSSDSVNKALVFRQSSDGSTFNERMRIDNSGNVGIGTNNPSAKLVVAGTIGVNASNQVKTYGSYPFDFTFNTLSSNILRVNMTGGGNYDEPALALFNDDSGATDWLSPRLQLTSWGGTPALGNTIEGRVQIETASTIGMRFNVATVAGSLLSTSPAYRFQNNGSNLMAINGNGSVGIGTTSPSARLQLPAGASTASMAPLKFTSGTNLTTPEAGAMEYDGTNLYITDNTNIRRTIATSGSGGSAYGAGSIIAASFGTASSPGLTFNGDTSTGFFRNGASTIGITAGGTNLWNISSSGIASPTTGGALIANSIGTASYPTYSFVGDTGTGWFRPAASTMAAATGGVERMRIDLAGKVGIGTTGPTNNLDVMGVTNLADATFGGMVNTVVTGPAATDSVRLNLGQNIAGGANLVMGGSQGGGGNPATPTIYFADNRRAFAAISGLPDSTASASNKQKGDMIFETTTDVSSYALAERMRITAAGTVGIGTASPSVPLEVQTTSTGMGIRVNRSGGASVDIQGGGNAGWIGTVTNHPLNFFTNNGAASMTVLANGNVGIGTTSPTGALMVAGSDAATSFTSVASPMLTVQNKNTASGVLNTINFSNYDNYSSAMIGTVQSNVGNVGNKLILATKTSTGTWNNSQLVLDPSGNIGIGTTNPNSLLTVEGVTALRETTVPSASASYGKLYVNSGDHKLYFMDQGGTATALGSSASTGPDSVLAGSCANTLIGTASTNYFLFTGNYQGNTTESARQIMLPRAGTLRNFYMRTSTVQPADQPLPCVLMQNGVATAIGVTIPASGAAGIYSDTTHSVTASAGDLIDLRCINNSASSSATVTHVSISFGN